MGSIDLQGIKAIDSSVGGLVWVRRRNGSWWPGRIMAHHEVPNTTVVSPKSGTPIKLLGREDASVDWYNLEKSKRVKAFRCGEYDACIETAKATASGISKKAVKYARREDAIVHALEIENAHLAKYDQEEVLIEKDDKDLQSKVKPLSKNRRRRRTPNDSEEDGTEGNKRMRGLEDIEISALVEAKEEDGVKSDISSMPSGTIADVSSGGCSPSMKKKRLQAVNANGYSTRKSRRKPLTKVSESTSMVSVPATCDKDPESKVSDVINNNNSDSNGVSCESVGVSLNASESGVEAIHNKAKESENSSLSVLVKDDLSDGLFDVPLVVEDTAGISTRGCGHDDVLKNDGSNGSACTSPADTLIDAFSTSKWQNKGKRTSRQMSKQQQEQRNAFASLPYQTPDSHFSGGTHAIGRKSQLYDVKIEAKDNYKKPRNVPLISLRSKLNGEAIVGHPIMVEVLEEGSYDHITSSHTKPLDVPMIEAAKRKPLSKKKSKKRIPHVPPHKSSNSKKSPSASIKTRCLSTLSGQKLTISSMKKAKKAEKKTKEQRVVACIPLNVVFSRINEAMKGSARQVHRALPSAAGIT
ncbi:unnamed protein product [Cochlearia groenlandica]